MKCPSCGVENRGESRFCFACGSALGPEPAPPAPAALPPAAAQAARRKEPDLIGFLGLGFLLVTLGIVLAANPYLFQDWVAWTDQMGTRGFFVRPPEGIITSGALFFVLSGAFGSLQALIRRMLTGRRLRALQDALGGAAAILFGGLLALYSARTVSGAFVLSAEAASVGILLLVYLFFGMYWSEFRWLPPETAGARPRP